MKRATLRDGNVLHARIPMMPVLRPMESGITEGALKYKGEIASGYDAKREDSEKWKAEDRIIRSWLEELRPESVLDVPVGTGRFLPLYSELGIPSVLGLDISEDMLRQASAKAGDGTFLRIGDARDLGSIGHYDVAICCRLMRWLETNETQLKVIAELMRVATKAVIFNARYATGPLPLPVELIDEACHFAGWRIANEEKIVDDFTMFMLTPMGGSDETTAVVSEQVAAPAPDGEGSDPGGDT